MRPIEIRLSTGLLLIGPPIGFPSVVQRAADRLTVDGLLRRLEHESLALGQMRKGWRRLHPAASAAMLDDADMVKAVRRDIAAGRLRAALLRDYDDEIAPAKLPDMAAGLINLPVGNQTVLIAPKGRLPQQFAPFRDEQAAAALVSTLRPGGTTQRRLNQQAPRLPKSMGAPQQDAALKQQVAASLNNGVCEAAVVTAPHAVQQAAARADAPKPIRDMDRGERVAEAMKRSLDHVGDEIYGIVAELVKPANLASMAAMIGLVALAQLTPFSAALVDGALVILALQHGGPDSVQAITKLVGATKAAMDATNEQLMDEAAKLYAAAFVGLGAAVLQALLKKAFPKGKQRSRQEDAPASNAAARDGGAGATNAPGRPNTAQPANAGAKPGPSSPPRGPGKRPSWRDSEKDVGKELGPGYSEQKSFIGGKEVPYGTKGSTRPDWFKPGHSVEVKNYAVATANDRARLVENVSGQAIQRAKDLPPNTVQSLVIDVRGQTISVKDANDLAKTIAAQSNGNIKATAIEFLRD